MLVFPQLKACMSMDVNVTLGAFSMLQVFQLMLGDKLRISCVAWMVSRAVCDLDTEWQLDRCHCWSGGRVQVFGSATDARVSPYFLVCVNLV